jgi:hypothetical protein
MVNHFLATQLCIYISELSRYYIIINFFSDHHYTFREWIVIWIRIISNSAVI